MLQHISEFISTTDNQFSFKKSHPNDMFIYLLKDVADYCTSDQATLFHSLMHLKLSITYTTGYSSINSSGMVSLYKYIVRLLMITR